MTYSEALNHAYRMAMWKFKDINDSIEFKIEFEVVRLTLSLTITEMESLHAEKREAKEKS
jgi:hypothetical protein